MTNATTETCNALWLDPFQPAGERERACLANAGLTLLPVRTLDDLRHALKSAQVVVVRLVGDTSLLTDVKHLIQAFKPNIPVFCRTDRQAFDLGIEAMQLGACHVLIHDDFSQESWRLAQAYLEKAQAASQKPHASATATAAAASPNTRVSEGAEGRGASVAPADQVTQADGGAALTHHQAGADGTALALQKTFVFVDPNSQKLLALAQRVAQAQVTTLITGPTGSGKEVLATVIHEASSRASGPFVSLNCGAIPEHLMEDMLFGHEKGAYTGAVREHKGIFEQAQGGTVFLDEIGELPLGLQAKLLRVLQERKVTRLGGSHEIALDFRLVAATNKDLKAAMSAREFREDLYFRISTFRLSIPALRQRPADILPLAATILSRHCPEAEVKRLSPSAQQALLAYHWPGNVRELENVIQRALVFCLDDTLEAEHLVFDDLQGDTPLGASMATSGPLGTVTPHAFDAESGNLDSQTAALQDISTAIGSPTHAAQEIDCSTSRMRTQEVSSSGSYGPQDMPEGEEQSFYGQAVPSNEEAIPSFSGSAPIRLPEL
ncbi:MAG: Nif-specific regulatory protein, partial [Pseudomonadota bacterium]